MKQAKLMPRSIQFLMTLIVLIGCLNPAFSQTQPQPKPLYYTGIVGGKEPWGTRVLLRWFTLEQFIPLETAIIYRTDKNGIREKIATVKSTRSASVIKNIFYRPGEEKILADAQATLERVYGTAGNTPDEFAEYVIDLLEGEDAAEYATTRRNFLIQTNYGFSIIEGYGFVDFVNETNGPFTYELWQGDAVGAPLEALGKITLDATLQMVLPPPANLKEIFLVGRDGQSQARANHRRIFLDWEVSPELFEKRDINFGFDIFKLNRKLEGGENFYTVQDELVQVNRLPILPPSPIAGEADDQSYLFADDGDWLETLNEDDLLPVGDTYTYWAVARDLLGNAGEPSAPLIATVRDTFEPDFPRGLNIVPSRNESDVPFLRVYFNRQDFDTSTYRLYRYQSYVNQGKPGPFPDVNGLTEGFIVEIPQLVDPEEDRVMFDDYEPGTAPPGQVFWYCVAAADEYGNISAISPPARGVIDDVLPPTLDQILQICGSRPILSATASSTLDSSTTVDTWRPLFKFSKEKSYYSAVLISRLEEIPGAGTRPVAIGELNLTSTGVQFFEAEEDESITGRDDIPEYEIEATTFDGRTIKTTLTAPTWAPGDGRPCYEIELGGRGTEENCLEIAIANDPVQVGVTPGGDLPPVKLKTPCSGETQSHRLYRSLNGGRTYTFVKEFGCGDDVDIDLVDDFHPEGLVQVKYSISPVDESGNIGIPYRVPAEFIYLGNVPRPTLTDVFATGSNIPSQRSVSVKWKGPLQGISHYTITIQPKPKPNSITQPMNPLEFAVSDANKADADGNFSFDEGTGEFSINVNNINRDGDSIEANVEYQVTIAAVPKVGTPGYGTNNMPLIWAADALGFNGGGVGELRWAARPLPEMVTGVEDLPVFILRQEENVRGGSVLIPIRFESIEFPSVDFIKPPMMVWRRRADIANQPWSSVSPVLEEIRRNGQIVDDPFFYKITNTVWFVDNSGHVPFRPYEYIILELNEHTYEIDRAIGPLEITVELIPQ